MSKMNHNFIWILTFYFRSLVNAYMDLKLDLHLFIGPSLNVIVFARNPFASFFNCFSSRFAKQPKVDFQIGFGGHINTSLDPSSMLHLSHSKNALCQSQKMTSINNKMFTHSFIDFMFNTSLSLSPIFYGKCINTKRIRNRIETLAIKQLHVQLNVLILIPCIPQYVKEIHPNSNTTSNKHPISDVHVQGSPYIKRFHAQVIILLFNILKGCIFSQSRCRIL